MLRVNKRMENLIEKVSKYECTNEKMSIESICKLISPEFKEIDGFFLLCFDGEEIPKRINVDKVIQVYGDRTGYECSCNEIRLNDYIDYVEGNSICVLKFALQLQKSWEIKVKSEYPEYKFCFILTYDEEYATLRFHKIRDEEEPYLLPDLESYSEDAIFLNII